MLHLKITNATAEVTVAAIYGRMAMGGDLMFLENDLKKLVEGGARKVVLDLASVEYVDSAGIGVLVGTAGLLRQVGGGLMLARPQHRVSEIFKMVRVQSVLPVFPDVESAALGFGEAAAAS